MTTDEFSTLYEQTISRLLRPMRAEDGCTEGEIFKAEEKVGVQFPALLRSFYLRSGRLNVIHEAQDRLVAPDQLQIVNKVLLFYEENQCVVFWGVQLRHCNMEDPPVVQAENRDKITWQPFQKRLSDFLIMMVYWQSVNGGMPFGGLGSIPPKRAERVETIWPLVMQHEALKVHSRDGQVVCLIGEDQVHVAGRSREDFAAIESRLNVDWDYSWPEE